LEFLNLKPGSLLANYIQANTDGRLHDATEPSISPLNRGFLYGDAVYEVWRTYSGVLFAFDEHLQRLQRSAGALHLDLPFDSGVLLTEIRRTASAFFDKMGGEKKDIYIRLNLTRGAGAIGLDIGLADKPTFVILVQYLRERPASIWEKGATLSLAKTLYRNHPKTLNPAWKTANYLNNLLCLREAKSRGADEVVILNLDGAITEAAVSNIFFVSGKEILTPPSSAGILNGVTRQILLDEIAKNWSFDLREENVFAPQLPEFTECFLTSTTQDILPVGKIDNVSYKVGPKTVTRELKTIFRKYVKDYCDRRENLRIF
jgi:branched-chain amino acid aminotransferase